LCQHKPRHQLLLFSSVLLFFFITLRRGEPSSLLTLIFPNRQKRPPCASQSADPSRACNAPRRYTNFPTVRSSVASSCTFVEQKLRSSSSTDASEDTKKCLSVVALGALAPTLRVVVLAALAPTINLRVQVCPKSTTLSHSRLVVTHALIVPQMEVF